MSEGGEILKKNKSSIEKDREWEETPPPSRDFQGANVLRCYTDTNTPKGGDSGHGGLTMFQLENLGGTDWRLYVNGKPLLESEFTRFKLVLGGDSECKTLADALIWAGETLKARIAKNETLQKRKKP